jgi:hypothetical protein
VFLDAVKFSRATPRLTSAGDTEAIPLAPIGRNPEDPGDPGEATAGIEPAYTALQAAA